MCNAVSAQHLSDINHDLKLGNMAVVHAAIILTFMSKQLATGHMHTGSTEISGS
jgi:hypothetical protein